MKILVAIFLPGLLIAGCSSDYLASSLSPDRYTADIDLIDANRQAARQLLHEQDSKISKSKPIINVTFASLDNLDQTTPMGRLISEQIATEMSKQGYRLMELRVRQEEILIEKQKGEFVLTRDTTRLLKSHDAQAILAGTYSVASNILFVTSKLINPNDNTVINAHSYDIALGPNALALLNRSLPVSRSVQDEVPGNEEWYEQQIIKDDDIVAF